MPEALRHSPRPSPSALLLPRRHFLSVVAGAGATLAGGCLTAKTTPADPEAWRGRITDHYDGERFFNPGQTTKKGWKDFWRWQWTREKPTWPAAVANAPFQRAEPSAEAPLLITPVGHCTFLLQWAGLNILTDPIYSDRCSPVSWAGPQRIRPPAIDWADLPEIHAVLLSHNHFDHLDLPTLRRLHERFRPQVLTGLGLSRFLAEEGVPGALEMDWWDTHVLPSGHRVAYVPAQHWSNRGGGSQNKTLWGGFHVVKDTLSLYFAGDSGYFSGFRTIAERLGSPTVALLPLGAYEPRWFMQDNHMSPADAVQAHLDLGARWSLPMHHDTFQLADETYEQPLQDLAASLHEKGVDPARFANLLPGQTRAFSAT